MDLSFEHLITDTLTLVDETTAGYVRQSYDNIGQYINGLITAAATFYIMWYGYQVLCQKVSLEVMAIARHIMLLCIIVALLTQWDFYYRFVYDVFTNEPVAISKALSHSDKSVTDGLNQIWKEGSTAASDLLTQVSFKNAQYFFYAAAVYAATFANCLYALCILVYAKIALALLLALGQIFIVMMLWQSTRELASGWIKGLLYFAFIPVITTAILSMTNVIAEKTLPGVQQGVASGATEAMGLLPYVALAFINGFLLKQTLTIAAMLSSSVSLDSIGSTANMMRNGVRGAKIAARPVRWASSRIANRFRDPNRKGKK